MKCNECIHKNICSKEMALRCKNYAVEYTKLDVGKFSCTSCRNYPNKFELDCFECNDYIMIDVHVALMHQRYSKQFLGCFLSREDAIRAIKSQYIDLTAVKEESSDIHLNDTWRIVFDDGREVQIIKVRFNSIDTVGIS